jgi:hypothetical protein
VTTCRMVYEQRVQKVPYRVCRMEAVQETVRVPRCVEKRIPVTYTCRVPRVVCCRVPIDPCGVPLEGCAPAVTAPPAEIEQPTPAAPEKKATDAEADVPPGLGPGEGTPQSFLERNIQVPEGPESESRTPARQSDVFGPNQDAST